MLSLRVLVTGSRSWDDEETIRKALVEVIGSRNPASVQVLHGDARGADRIAAQVATELGCRVRSYPADWDRHGRQAGYIRNVAMVQTQPSMCLAFIRDDSAGASHCAGMAESKGIPTVRYRYDLAGAHA